MTEILNPAPQEEKLPRDVVTASQIRDELLRGRVSPALAALSIQKIFEKQGLDAEEAYLRVISQQQFFSDSNEPLSQTQAVRWDNFVICIGQSLAIPEERRIRERLVPVGTPSAREDLEDLAF